MDSGHKILSLGFGLGPGFENRVIPRGRAANGGLATAKGWFWSSV
jgi:hypothetical protein